MVGVLLVVLMVSTMEAAAHSLEMPDRQPVTQVADTSTRQFSRNQAVSDDEHHSKMLLSRGCSVCTLLHANALPQESASDADGAASSDVAAAAPGSSLVADTNDLPARSAQQRRPEDQQPALAVRSGDSDHAKFGIATLMLLGLAVAFIMIATGMIRLLR